MSRGCQKPSEQQWGQETEHEEEAAEISRWFVVVVVGKQTRQNMGPRLASRAPGERESPGRPLLAPCCPSPPAPPVVHHTCAPWTTLRENALEILEAKKIVDAADLDALHGNDDAIRMLGLPVVLSEALFPPAKASRVANAKQRFSSALSGAMSGMVGTGEVDEQKLREVFDQIDIDGNGTLDHDEIRSALSSMGRCRQSVSAAVRAAVQRFVPPSVTVQRRRDSAIVSAAVSATQRDSQRDSLCNSAAEQSVQRPVQHCNRQFNSWCNSAVSSWVQQWQQSVGKQVWEPDQSRNEGDPRRHRLLRAIPGPHPSMPRV